MATRTRTSFDSFDGPEALHGMNRVIALLVFLSGMSGLMYEVLWFRQLGLLFGNSAQASAATLAAFFLGLGAGNWWWGTRVARMKRILEVYAGLELGILASGCAYFGVLHVFAGIYPWLLRLGGNAAWALLVKFALALVLICPGAFFMGGTLPVLSQLLVRQRGEFGRTASRLYGINTVGAALGAYLSGFVLPPAWGYFRTYVTALGVTAGVALAALVLARRTPRVRRQRPGAEDLRPPGAPGALELPLPVIASLCFASGLGTLALEVLWTHMFTQVYMNSVYTFAAILVTTLLGLAGGAALAGFLARRRLSGARVLLVLLVGAGIAVCSTPFVFMALTDGMQVVAGRAGWGSYIIKIFALTIAVLGVPLCALGAVFPYLLKLSEQRVSSAGRMFGRLAAVNTAGVVCGSLLAGFLLLRHLGTWRSIRAIAVLYPVLAAVLLWRLRALGWAWRLTVAVGLLLTVGSLWRTDLPPMHLLPDEKLLAHWYGASGTIAVVEQPERGRVIKLNGHYGLGSTGGGYLEKGQASIPMMIHPSSRSVFFLGLGTGITAAEACSEEYGLERIVACELVPEVVTAARRYFRDHTEALFTDPRCRLVVDDGRHYLHATAETFDIINSDLFLVYRKGTGSLYSLEHFRGVESRLAPDGIFVLWLPLYQLTRREFLIVARTMLEVFPQVTVWRNQFCPWKDTVALVGQTSPRPLLPEGHAGLQAAKRREVWRRRGHRPHEANLLLYYCGNLGRARELFADVPLNTDDRPLVEYLAPVSSSLQAADKVVWLAGPHFIALLDELREMAPPETDPALAGLPRQRRGLATAGYYLARALLMESYYVKTGRQQPVWRTEARKARAKFERLWLQE